MADPVVARLVDSRRSTSAAVGAFIQALEAVPHDIQARCPYWVVYGVSLRPIAIRRKQDGALLMTLKPLAAETLALTWARSAGDVEQVLSWTHILGDLALRRDLEVAAAEALTAAWAVMPKD